MADTEASRARACELNGPTNIHMTGRCWYREPPQRHSETVCPAWLVFPQSAFRDAVRSGQDRMGRRQHCFDAGGKTSEPPELEPCV